MSKVEAALDRARRRRVSEIRAQAEAARQQELDLRFHAQNASRLLAEQEAQPESWHEYSRRMAQDPSNHEDFSPWSDQFDELYGHVDFSAPWPENQADLEDLKWPSPITSSARLQPATEHAISQVSRRRILR
jgi:hypothetical protein